MHHYSKLLLLCALVNDSFAEIWGLEIELYLVWQVAYVVVCEPELDAGGGTTFLLEREVVRGSKTQNGRTLIQDYVYVATENWLHNLILTVCSEYRGRNSKQVMLTFNGE